jgi:ATP-grasp domain/ATP-grasp N-terminal domain
MGEAVVQNAFVLFGGYTGSAATRSMPFLSELRARGLSVLVVDQPVAGADRSPISEAFLGYVADTLLTPANDPTRSVLLERVRAWARAYRIRGMLCIQEVWVEAAALAADYLGLPSPGLRAGSVCRNKHLQRLYLEAWSPAVASVPPEQRLAATRSFKGFPAVLKPTGRSCSAGVQLIRDREHLRSVLLTYPPHEDLLLEQRIVGREYSVESLVQNGRVIFESVTEKATNEDGSNFFVEMGHTVPATNLATHERAHLLDVNRAILHRLAFADGMAHAEYRVSAAGEVRLMEVAARPPGDCLLSLYHLATGQPLEPALISIALGEDVAYGPPVRYARQVYLDHEPRRLRDVVVHSAYGVAPDWFYETGERQLGGPGAADGRPELREILILKRRGDVLSSIASSYDRAVTFLIDAPTPAELNELEKQLRQQISILTEPACLAA